MPRKPNYKFDRIERDRAKAAKKLARLEAKRAKSEQKKMGDGEFEPDAEAAPATADGAVPATADDAAPETADRE